MLLRRLDLKPVRQLQRRRHRPLLSHLPASILELLAGPVGGAVGVGVGVVAIISDAFFIRKRRNTSTQAGASAPGTALTNGDRATTAHTASEKVDAVSGIDSAPVTLEKVPGSDLS